MSAPSTALLLGLTGKGSIIAPVHLLAGEAVLRTMLTWSQHVVVHFAFFLSLHIITYYMHRVHL